MEYIDITHPEWQKMWDELAQYVINEGDQLCIYLGQSWEYLGSNKDYHHFRHELHPATGRTEYIYIERTRAAVGWG